MNFTALVILVEFDNVLFSFANDETLMANVLQEGELSLPGSYKKRSLKEILAVQVTTSRHAILPLEEHRMKLSSLDGSPKYIHLGMNKRPSCCNKFARIFYGSCRLLYVSVWFYYVPFAVILISFEVPKIFGAEPTLIYK